METITQPDGTIRDYIHVDLAKAQCNATLIDKKYN
jgi:UDP-glucose 4-epimerase